MKNFTHLHVHTIYSALDGTCKPKDIAEKCIEYNMKACAITDHNHLGGCYAFQKALKDNNIKPILGYEGYYTKDISIASKPVDERHRLSIKKARENGVNISDTDYEKAMNNKPAYIVKKYKNELEPYLYDMRQYHILYLAMNQNGWRNLVKLQSESSEKCTYNGRFLADFDLIRKYSDDVICTTACLGSYPAHMIMDNKIEEAEKYILTMKDIFKDRFYLEIQPLNSSDQAIVNVYYIEFAQKYNIKLIATTDVHYLNKEDWNDHDTYICIQIKAKKSDANRMKYADDLWFKSYDDMIQTFTRQIEENSIIISNKDKYIEAYTLALQETNKLANRIDNNILIGSKTTLYPVIPHDPSVSSDDILRVKALNGLNKYLEKHPELDKEVYRTRLFEELEVITFKHYSDYFLMVAEYVAWGNSIDPSTGYPRCVVGPGRGSADGSLVLFTLEISRIDPIKNDLMFERFLSVDRNTCPDIDSDFDWETRDDLIEHLEELYGKNHVAHIGTWTYLSVLSGFKDFARALDVPFNEANSVTEQIRKFEPVPQAKFKDYDMLETEDPASYKILKDLEKKYPEIFRLTRKFEGSCRQYGIHASGVLVTPVPISEVTPIRIDNETGVSVTLFSGVELDEQQLVKLDLLGLKTLTVIKWALQHIQSIDNPDKTMSFEELYSRVQENDANTFKMIRDKKVDGVFQIESDMFKGVIDLTQPNSLDDLSAMVAIGRPGPLSAGYGQMYSKGKQTGEYKYSIRGCEDILDKTYGVMIYQEQPMLISKKICGFNGSQADALLRKAIGKKKAEMFPMIRRCMIYGKKNCKGPEGWETDNNAPWYDPKKKYGAEISGALVNGYTVEELNSFFEDLVGFGSYAFNKSHSYAYGYILLLTAWLKCYYPTQFMSALLSIQADDKKKNVYINACRNSMNIKVTVPDINKSDINFTPDPENMSILYGLGSIRGIGDAKLEGLISNKPYTSLEDMVKRLPKSVLNKTVGENLIKAGALERLDVFKKNRFSLLNEFYNLRNDKKAERYEEESFTDDDIIEMENEVLGSSVTFIPRWFNMIQGYPFKEEYCTILSVKEHTIKKSGLPMGMLSVNFGGAKVDCVMFNKEWSRLMNKPKKGDKVYISGTKSKENKMIINTISSVKSNTFANTFVSGSQALAFDPFA